VQTDGRMSGKSSGRWPKGGGGQVAAAASAACSRAGKRKRHAQPRRKMVAGKMGGVPADSGKFACKLCAKKKKSKKNSITKMKGGTERT